MSTEANSINAATTGIVGNTGTSFTGTAVTNHNVIVGGSTSSTLTNVAPSATSGVPLISQGAAADPAFGTAVVAGGGTGDTSFTAYAVICGGTTSTGALQSVASVGSSGQVLVSNGAGALPTFQSVAATNAFDNVTVQVFTGSGTYTPTSGMKYCVIEAVGGGAGGGGTASAAGSTLSFGGSGGGGGYSRKVASAATVGSSQTVTIGGGGNGGTAGNNPGNNGGDTSVGSICIGKGGTGGSGSNGSALSAGGAGGVAGTGDFSIPGQPGMIGVATNNTTDFRQFGAASGHGFGFGGTYTVNTTPATGPAGQNYGGGGTGGISFNGNGTAAGGNGASGLVIITEYASV